MTTYRVGDVLSGGYRVIDVKRGGMGVVYICHQPPDRFYAVKTVDPATAATQAMILVRGAPVTGRV